MDYHSIHGHDVSSFDISGTHRLPTVQASQALNDLQDDSNLYLSTGLEALDKALSPPSPNESRHSPSNGGIKRGQLTEIWGPPGTGKTAVSIQLAVNSIRNGNDVVWIDCFQDVQISRLEQVLAATESTAPPASTESKSTPSSQGQFVHFSCLTLPHFMALVSRPSTKILPEKTVLVVISNLSALVNSSLPKSIDAKSGNKGNKGPRASAKRLQGLQFIINALQKLAATRNCAVLISSQCATRMQSEQGATLVPAVNATVWDQGVSTRVVMFRDWAWKDGKLMSIFMAGVQKLDGRSGYEVSERLGAFTITTTGIARVEYDTSNIPVEPADMVRHKRKREQTDFEVPDSEDDEDYGWADDDETALPAPPPQWQGSEDILLGQDLVQSDDGRDENEDADGFEASHTQSSEGP